MYLRLNGAPAEILAMADRLSDKTYEDMEDVMGDLAVWFER